MKQILLLFFGLFLVIGLGVGFFYYGFSAPEQVTSPLQPTIPPASQTTPTTSIIEQDTAAIKTVISEFYTAYTSCLSQPPAEARGRVSLYCQEEIAFTTDAFLENLQENKATLFRADPVLCSQNTGGSTSVETVDYEDPQRAVATVVSQSGNGFAQKISVIVLKEQGTWLVDTVVCPGS